MYLYFLLCVFVLLRGERVRATLWKPEGTPLRGEHEGQRAQRQRTT